MANPVENLNQSPDPQVDPAQATLSPIGTLIEQRGASEDREYAVVTAQMAFSDLPPGLKKRLTTAGADHVARGYEPDELVDVQLTHRHRRPYDTPEAVDADAVDTEARKEQDTKDVAPALAAAALFAPPLSSGRIPTGGPRNHPSITRDTSPAGNPEDTERGETVAPVVATLAGATAVLAAEAGNTTAGALTDADVDRILAERQQFWDDRAATVAALAGETKSRRWLKVAGLALLALLAGDAMLAADGTAQAPTQPSSNPVGGIESLHDTPQVKKEKAVVTPDPLAYHGEKYLWQVARDDGNGGAPDATRLLNEMVADAKLAGDTVDVEQLPNGQFSIPSVITTPDGKVLTSTKDKWNELARTLRLQRIKQAAQVVRENVGQAFNRTFGKKG